MKTEDLRAQVLDKLKWLRLPGMAASLDALLDRAQKNNLTVLEAIDQLLDEERRSRIGRSVDRRIKNARFPELNTIDGFTFDFDPARKKLRARYLCLHDLGFLQTGINPLFIGVPGTGKTFLARALAYRACQGQRRVVLVEYDIVEFSRAELTSLSANDQPPPVVIIRATAEQRGTGLSGWGAIAFDSDGNTSVAGCFLEVVG